MSFDSFAFTLDVETFNQGTALRIALSERIADLWKYRSDTTLRDQIKATIPLLRRAREAGRTPTPLKP